MRTETLTITVEARDDITRDEIVHDLRPLLEQLQEPEPWRHDTGDAWYVNRRSYVQIHDPAQASDADAGAEALLESWHKRAQKFRVRANKLGNCQAGKEAFIEATAITRCADDLRGALRGARASA